MEFHFCPWLFLLFIALLKIARVYFPQQKVIEQAENAVEEALQNMMKSGIKKEDLIKHLLSEIEPKRREEDKK